MRVLTCAARGRVRARLSLARARLAPRIVAPRVCSVLAVLTAQVSPPFPDRPTEGLLTLNVEVPAMAGPGYEVRSSGSSSEPLHVARVARVVG